MNLTLKPIRRLIKKLRLSLRPIRRENLFITAVCPDIAPTATGERSRCWPNKMKARDIIIILLVFSVFSFIVFAQAIFNLGNFQDLKITEIFYLIGKLAGLTGFLCLSLLVFSGDTARFFDKFFGLDKIIKFQRKFSLVSMIFILLHPIFFILSTKSILPYVIPDFSVIPFALGIISFYIFFEVFSNSNRNIKLHLHI